MRLVKKLVPTDIDEILTSVSLRESFMSYSRKFISREKVCLIKSSKEICFYQFGLPSQTCI